MTAGEMAQAVSFGVLFVLASVCLVLRGTATKRRTRQSKAEAKKTE